MNPLIPLLAVAGVTAVSMLQAASALIAAMVSAAVGFMLRRRIQEIHIMVNARFSDVVLKLTDALAENVRLKDKAGEPPGPPVESALAETGLKVVAVVVEPKPPNDTNTGTPD